LRLRCRYTPFYAFALFIRTTRCLFSSADAFDIDTPDADYFRFRQADADIEIFRQPSSAPFSFSALAVISGHFRLMSSFHASCRLLMPSCPPPSLTLFTFGVPAR